MAHLLHNCCCPEDQDGDTDLTDCEPVDIATSVCSGGKYYRYWEIEISGMQHNPIWCEEVQNCVGCYELKPNIGSEGTRQCYGGYDYPGSDGCYTQPIDDINGLYCADINLNLSSCNQVKMIGRYSTSEKDAFLSTRECVRPGPPPVGACNGYSGCWYGNDRTEVLFGITGKDYSGGDADGNFVGPDGWKVFMWEHDHFNVGCRRGPGNFSEYAGWMLNDMFRAVNETFNCVGNNTFTNEITSGAIRSNSDDTFTVPLYIGGTITMRPMCETCGPLYNVT